jgi:hypothetical protein
MMRLGCLVLVIVVMGSACTTTSVSTGRRPSWMENPQRKYPFRYYLSAVGEGDTLQDAQAVAVGNLAKIFKSDVEVDERLQERYVELIGRRNRYQEETKFDRNVRVRSGVSLVNVQYPDSYTDGAGRVYALAVLNRARTAEIIATRLRENDERTVTFVDQSRDAAPDVAYAALSAAAAVSRDSRVSLEQLDVISPAAKRSIHMTHDHESLMKRLAEAASLVRFDVRVSDDRDGKVAAALSSLMTDLGFVVGKGEQALRAVGSVTLENTDLKREGLSFVRYELKVEILNAAGITVVSVTDRGREGHVSPKEAEARCVRSIVSLLDRTLRDRLIAYFDALVAGN